MMNLVKVEIYGREFHIDRDGEQLTINETDLNQNFQAVGGKRGWFVREETGGYRDANTAEVIFLEQMTHRIPEALIKAKNLYMDVYPTTNYKTGKEELIIRWPDGGMSLRDGKCWKTKWSDGSWVIARKEHISICNEVVEKSFYNDW